MLWSCSSLPTLPDDWTITRSEVERQKRRVLRRIGRKVRKALKKKGRLKVERGN